MNIRHAPLAALRSNADQSLDKAVDNFKNTINPYFSGITKIINNMTQGLLEQRLLAFFKDAPVDPDEITNLEKFVEENIHASPQFRDEVLRLCNQTRERYFQFLFAQEFGKKTPFDQVFLSKFNFNRSIIPVLGNYRPEQFILRGLESLFIKDRLFVDDSGETASLKKDKISGLGETSTGKNLEEIRKLKAEGKRVWIIASHPAYFGAYMPRRILQETGFNGIADNWNAICGPRVMANAVLKPGTLNIGNCWMTLPSEKTTPIETPGLSEAYGPLTNKTAALIKGGKFAERVKNWEPGEKELYEKLKGEVFIVWPEGSRSNILDDGTISMKYIDPTFLRMFLSPGDYIVPMSQSGAEKMNKNGSYTIKQSEVALSVGKPIEVTSSMIQKQNIALVGYNIAQAIAALKLPNGQQTIYSFTPNGDKIEI